jgi:hypothetical protein
MTAERRRFMVFRIQFDGAEGRRDNLIRVFYQTVHPAHETSPRTSESQTKRFSWQRLDKMKAF